MVKILTFLLFSVTLVILSSVSLCTHTVNMCKCFLFVVWQPLFLTLHLSEELRTFSGLLSIITPDCYHFTEDHSHRQSILEEKSGICAALCVWLTARSMYYMTSLHIHTLFIFTCSLALTSQLVMQNS